MQLPKKGQPAEEVLDRMREAKEKDADWRAGKTWSLIYPAGEEVDALLREANQLYVFENALNPFRFPSLATMEQEICSMTRSLLNAPEGAGGTLTSGGTESILMSVKTARNRAREERGIEKPEMIVPISAHPAFAKAAEYLGLELRQAPLAADLRVDVDAVRALVTPNTVLLVGSAPNYPHGMIDPIPELAAIAEEAGASFHTDACVGGFLLPFLEKLGVEIPPWDFRVAGVTTISADVHKYGFATKGASIISHREKSSLRHQIFLFDKWPGGLYGSPALAGARPAAPIAAAWAVMNFLGEEGYLRLAGQTLAAAKALRVGIAAIPGLQIVGTPVASVQAFASDRFDIMAIGDVMDDLGWHLDRQKDPAALHMMVSPEHEKVVEPFLADLRRAVEKHGDSRGEAVRYS
ncbi:MAG: aspartate aminotransferase family protein [Deltaproteobacteria bacterium]